MESGGRHRNSQKRFYTDNAVYFITTVTYQRFPYFAEPLFAEIFVHDLRFASVLKQCEIHGYAVMPDHVHLLVWPRGRWKISEFMTSLKRNVARDTNIILSNGNLIRNFIEDMDSHVEGADSHVEGADSHVEGADSHVEGADSHVEGADSNPRLLENFQITHREHPHITFDAYKNHFKMMRHIQHRFHLLSGQNHSVPKFQWQKSYHDHIIRNDPDYIHHLKYIYGNAVRHRLVEKAEEWSWMWVTGMEKGRDA